jgi:EAL domain-containing protein (putative c-di-GMP-specific phosphodiesterase class I)
VKTLADHAPLTNPIVSMCQLMNFHIVAEGVETPAQLAWPADRKCDEHRGFLFSPATDAASFEAMLTAQASLPRADVIQVHL